MITSVIERAGIFRIFLASCLGLAGSYAFAQDSWSDSVPRIMKLVRNCPVKVRDKNGEWANFKSAVPVGHNVVGAINPRRPDLVFFQLSRDSRYMFSAPRTCFEGEEKWNVEQQEEKLQGVLPVRNRHTSLYLSLDWIRDGASIVPSTATGSAGTAVTTRIRGAELGFAWEKGKDQWYWGFGAGLGMGQGQYRLTSDATADLGYGAVAIYGTGRGTVYYDFLSIPQAMGLEVYGGFAKTNFVVPQVSSVISPSIDILYGVALAWRFYWDKVALSPKITMNKFKPANISGEVQISYIFGGR